MQTPNRSIRQYVSSSARVVLRVDAQFMRVATGNSEGALLSGEHPWIDASDLMQKLSHRFLSAQLLPLAREEDEEHGSNRFLERPPSSVPSTPSESGSRSS